MTVSISDVEEATGCARVLDVVLRMEKGDGRFDVRVLVGMGPRVWAWQNRKEPERTA